MRISDWSSDVCSSDLIAAVEGYALGGGFEIALTCDLIVAGDSARFGLPEVKRGLVANAGGLVRLPRQLPRRIASELVLTGELVAPPWLASHGLINRVVESGTDRKSTRLNSSHKCAPRMPS